MKLRLFISLLFFGILTACGGGGGGGSSATDTSVTNPSGSQNTIQHLVRSVREQNVNLVSTNNFDNIKTQLEEIAGRELTNSEVDAVVVLLNRGLTEEYCGQRSQVLSDDGRSCQNPEPTCNLQHRTSSGVSYWTCGYSAADCEAAGKVLDSFKVGVCVAPTEAQCRERNQELNAARDACETSIASCNAADKIYNSRNDSCESCPSDRPDRYKNTCRANAQICASRNQVLQGFVCVALTDAYCRGRGQRLNDASDACRALVVADCTSQGQLLNANGTDCRDVVASDCTLDEQVFDNGACRAVTNADCTAVNKVLDNNRCRPLVANDCTDNQIFENNECRALTVADCEREDQILSNGACQSCTGDNSVRYDNVCGPSAEVCERRFQVLRGASCAAPTQSECTSRGQRLNKDSTSCRYVTADECKADGMVLNGEGTACRALVAADCVPLNLVFDSGQCRARTQSDCTALNQKLDTTTNNCRAWKATDCTTTEVFDNNNCRTRIAADCNTKNQILSGGVCVACSGNTPVRYDNVCGPTAQQCQSRGQVLHGAVCVSPSDRDCRNRNQRLNDRGDACRALVASDCLAGTILNDAGNACRPLTGADCSARGMILGAEGCRALIASDCQEGKVLNDAGNACRRLTGVDCSAHGLILNRKGTACRALIASDCQAGTRLNQAGTACRALVQGDCPEGMKLNKQGTACRILTNSDCPAGTKLKSDGRACRALIASDCQEGTILNGAGIKCRALVESDCPDGTRLNPQGTACHFSLTAADCARQHKLLNDAGNACRNVTMRDCETHYNTWPATGEFMLVRNVCIGLAHMVCYEQNKVRDPEHPNSFRCAACPAGEYVANVNICARCPAGKIPNDAGSACRALVASDCSQSQVFENGACRLQIAGDCSPIQVFENGVCRLRIAGDCLATEQFNNGICRALVAADCSPIQVFENGVCRARVASDCDTGESLVEGLCVTRVASAEDCPSGKIFDAVANTCRDKRIIPICPVGTVPDSSVESGCRDMGYVHRQGDWLSNTGIDCPDDESYRDTIFLGELNHLDKCYADRKRARSGLHMQVANAWNAHQKGYMGQGVTIGLIHQDMRVLHGRKFVPIFELETFDLSGTYVPHSLHVALPNKPKGWKKTIHVDFRYDGRGLEQMVGRYATGHSDGHVGVAPQAKVTFLRSNFWDKGLSFSQKVPSTLQMQQMADSKTPIVVMPQETRWTETSDTLGGIGRHIFAKPFPLLKKRGYTRLTLSVYNQETSSWEEETIIEDVEYIRKSYVTRPFFWDKKFEKKDGSGSTSMKNLALSLYGQFKDDDTVFVWTGNHATQRYYANEDLIAVTGDALAPLMIPELRDNWIVANQFLIGNYYRGDIRDPIPGNYYSMCGKAKDWCLRAPVRYSTIPANMIVGGGLAVLKSVAPLH